MKHQKQKHNSKYIKNKSLIAIHWQSKRFLHMHAIKSYYCATLNKTLKVWWVLAYTSEYTYKTNSLPMKHQLDKKRLSHMTCSVKDKKNKWMN
jgi:hypothetical protein